MTTTWQALVSEARELVLAGDLDGAESKKRQAEAIKSLDAMTTTTDPAQGRLPMPAAETPVAAPSLEAYAVKAAYVKKYGEPDAAQAQVTRELYGYDDYPALRAAKMRALNHYCKSGQLGDYKLARMILLTPDQIAAAIWGGVAVSGSQDSIKATMVEAQDSLGGFLVPEELNTDMVQRLPGLTVVRARARKFNTSRDALSFLVRTGGNKRYIGNVRSRMTSESPSAGSFDTNATFGKLIVPVHVNLSKVPVSKSLLEDSALDIMSQVLMPEFITDAAIKEDAQFLTGTGADEPQGILNGTAANGAPFNADITTKASGQAAAITFDALVDAPWKIAGQYRNKRNPSTAWAFTSATGGVIAQLKDSTGAYLWTEMHGNNGQGNPDTIRGWSYAESEALPEIAANTYPVIFGDFQGYRIVDRVGMSVERYSDSATADTDSVVFFCRRRYGGQVAEGYRFVVIKIAAS